MDQPLDDQPLDIITAYDPEGDEYVRRARRDVQLMLEDKLPPEGEDYGLWEPQMTELLQEFDYDGSWGVEEHLMTMMRGRDAEVEFLLRGALTRGRRSWHLELREALDRREESARAAAAAAEAEARRKEREREWAAQRAQWREDYISKKILRALRERDHSRTELFALFSRNVSAKELDASLDLLEFTEYICRQSVSTGGRPREVWKLRTNE